MQQPPGFEDSEHPHYICRLKKAIYGLKQAPRAWYYALQNYLCDHGFVKSKSNDSLFISSKGSNKLHLLVYVDDIILTGTSASAIDSLVELLAAKFSLKDLCQLHHFLGIDVAQKQNEILLSQSTYIGAILQDENMTNCNSAPTPMVASQCLATANSPSFDDPSRYRSVLGKLQYLSFTRPDIAFSVNKLSQYMHSPTLHHWRALKRLLRYLKGTIHLCLRLTRHQTFTLQSYADADWASDTHDRVSTSGYVLYFGETPICWTSKKQRTVARSSTEAEYRYVASAVVDIIWVENLLGELGILLTTTPRLYCDKWE